MSSSAPLDSYDVQCVKCFSPLKDGERFCAVCGWDQEPWLPAPEKPKPGEVDIELDLDAPDTLPPAEYEASLKQGQSPPGVGLAVMDSAVALPGSAAAPPPFWQQEANDAAGPSRWSRRVPALLVSLAVVLGIVALALVVDRFYFDSRSEYGRLRELKASVAEVRAALRRGDLTAADRMLEALDADHPDDAGVQKLREELDQREEALAATPPAAVSPPRQAQSQAQPQMQVQPTPPAAAVARPPEDRPLDRAALAASDKPPSNVPAPTPVAAAPDEKPCNAALAAMSLCPKAPPVEAAPEAAPPP